jgi:hypothetical protein
MAFLKEDDFNRSWFDFVIGGMNEYPVLFSSGHRERQAGHLSGKIVEVGMGLYHKYREIVVVRVKAPLGFYLCPLSRLVPNPSIKWGSVEIASRTGENPCTVTLYWYEYGGHTVVSEG